eukprot:g2235.t1
MGRMLQMSLIVTSLTAVEPHCSLLFTHYSNYQKSHRVPPYVLDSLTQARFWNPSCDIFFVSESNDSLASLQIPPALKVIEVADDSSQSFNSRLFPHLASGGLWVESLRRIYSISSVMTRKNLTDVILIESDNLMYVDFSTLIPTLRAMYPPPHLAATQLNDELFTASVLWVSSLEAIWSFINWLQHSETARKLSSEMKMLGAYAAETQLLVSLPLVPSSFQNKYPALCKGAAELGYVFDSASYGQYLDGTESERIPNKWIGDHQLVGAFMKAEGVRPQVNHAQGLSNESIQIIVLNPGGVKLANLHLHTKRTHRYLSIGATWPERNASYYGNYASIRPSSAFPDPIFLGVCVCIIVSVLFFLQRLICTKRRVQGSSVSL